MMNPQSQEQLERPNHKGRRGCWFYIKRGMKGFSLIILILIVVGIAYQSIATEIDNRTYSPRGQRYDVNGHQMHIVCMGEGSPAVILQAGASAESLWWYRVQHQLAEHTHVCAFDRPGMGWSQPASTPRDPVTQAREVHLLLEQAGIEAPYIMAGHSFGAIWTRIYASEYPEDISGIVLVDTAIVTPKQFDSKSDYQQWQTTFNLIHVPLWTMSRTGLARLLFSSQFINAGYPTDISAELAALYSRNQTFDAYYAEYIPVFSQIQEASSNAEHLDVPMIVLWAGIPTGVFSSDEAREAFYESYYVTQKEIEGYSSNAVTRTIEGSNHVSILGNEAFARQVTSAILDVIRAGQTDEPLSP